ncbi:MAG: transcription antitermination factor NusB [Lentimicrobiaceae bacterium]|jgi:N utilization substance protein B|nr:transcription antitermination factor NusB [Lentimicrobiaceae bacterium]
MQALYSFLQSENEEADNAERQLKKSIEKLYELFIFQLSICTELVDFAANRFEDAKLKFFPTADELSPNTKFIDNQFIKLLSQNIDFRRKIEYYSINWSNDIEFIRKLFQQIKESKVYQEYIASDNINLQEDIHFFKTIYKKHIFTSEILQSICEEHSIYWVDDFDTAAVFVIKFIDSVGTAFDSSTLLPTLFKSDGTDEKNEDELFVKNLFRKTFVNSNRFDSLIAEALKNWELERIALMDIILIKMALCEFIDFPSIPVKVTMNEYIEIAKMYSTPRSSIFVNGILDKLVVDLKNQKKIVKIGRGLME